MFTQKDTHQKLQMYLLNPVIVQTHTCQTVKYLTRAKQAAVRSVPAHQQVSLAGIYYIILKANLFQQKKRNKMIKGGKFPMSKDNPIWSKH